jgi:hypothetical protein
MTFLPGGMLRLLLHCGAFTLAAGFIAEIAAERHAAG